jgi:hypothetical protein
METPELVQELLDKKAAEDNTIDLNAYAHGLLDMYNKVVSKLNREYDIVHVESMLS